MLQGSLPRQLVQVVLGSGRVTDLQFPTTQVPNSWSPLEAEPQGGVVISAYQAMSVPRAPPLCSGGVEWIVGGR